MRLNLPKDGELRTITTPVELRDGEGEGEAAAIEGYAAKFNVDSGLIWGEFIERIAPEAFDRALKEKQDVRALLNHDPNIILGRTKSGTLSLFTDKVGLGFKCLLPDTQAARDVAVNIKRGDVDQCSFAFRVVKDEWDESGDVPVRTLVDVDLFDVSAVVYPAYEGTNVSARAQEEVRAIRARREAQKAGAPVERFARMQLDLDRRVGR